MNNSTQLHTGPAATLRRLLALTLLVLGLATVTACHTVQGAGKDIQDAGQAVEKAADKSTDGEHN